VLDTQTQDKIKLVTSESNSCDYCKAALCTIGSSHGLSSEDLVAARRVEDTSPKTAAILELASELVKQQGHVSANDIEAARAAGVSDAEIVETIAVVVNAFFTNYINNALKTDVDFPAAVEIEEDVMACSTSECRCSH
jgi:AhpD family alkylhydroperoxidase